jgi:uncharacterized protein (DUF2252 family)
MDNVAHIEEQVELGRAERERVPRSSLGEWQAAPDRRDPVDVLVTAGEGRLEELLPIRYGRMAVSPFTFLRGSASVMAGDLASLPTTSLRVQACGDCHLLNFGLFASPERDVVFGLNDFDETLPAPWDWDVKRLVASFVVATRDVRIDDTIGKTIVESTVRAYREHLWHLSTMSPLDVWYDKLDMQTALADAPDQKARKRREALERRARARVAENLFPKIVVKDSGKLRLADQPPLMFHSPDITEEVAREFISVYRDSLPHDRQVLLDRYTYQDAAIKVVGVGSVGTRCFVALFASDAGHPLLLQVKEANRSVLEPYAGEHHIKHNGQRVVVGQHLMQPASDIFLGWGSGPLGREFYVRQLRDMKLSVTLTGGVTEFTAYGQYCARALARAHANTGSGPAIAGYLGKSAKADRAFADFAVAYADQSERDHRVLVDAIDTSRVPAIMETE